MSDTEKTPKFKTETCRCGTEFTYEVKRGRPQVWCDSCRNSANASAREKLRTEEERSMTQEERWGNGIMTPTERIDYLEFLLRSRGTHISQHRTDLW